MSSPGIIEFQWRQGTQGCHLLHPLLFRKEMFKPYRRTLFSSKIFCVCDKIASERKMDINRKLKWNVSSFLIGSLVSNKGPSVLGGKTIIVKFCALSDNLSVEDRCAVNLIVSQKTVIFPRAGIFSILKHTNHCYHSSNLSSQSGVWNIKLEYIISKEIILAKFTPNWNNFSQTFFNKRVTALLGTDNCLLTLTLFFWATGNVDPGNGFMRFPEKNIQTPPQRGKYRLLGRIPKRKNWLPLLT